MLSAQEKLAISTKEFLRCRGLKAKFVAEVCRISENVFSQFVNHKLALSPGQITRLTDFMTDYERRND